ncbi:hypothetical protein GTY65_17445 [Streptomyces sp. SID8379]|uniref:hypothetical protein n=1 Tax=unclassified Streptomyces TaxID=2593676 RepID=UPI000375B4B9|nr:MULTISPECIES: hypothetical protein [unclassified Streptomyces]MYW65825.1 hypothetical protein [Streptomyces sp. SID8379]
MDAALTAAALLVLITVATYVIHRLNTQHAERIAVHTYSRFLPGRRATGEPGPGAAPLPPLPQVPPLPSAAAPSDRHDHRDGGRGRHPARRRRTRTTHKRAD